MGYGSYSANLVRNNVWGGAGNDWLYGGYGEDWMFGGWGNDRLFGGDGNDRLYGEDGADSLYGGRGDDALYGGYGDDWLLGEDGNDWLFGESGYDWLYGGNGNDYLDGGSGVDVLLGEEGGDYINGGLDGDWIYTGGGWDYVAFNHGNSGKTSATADHVMDFDIWRDTVDADIAGTWWNYEEFTLPMASADLPNYDPYGNFSAYASLTETHSGITHTFITNGVDGFLFSDLNGDGYRESALVLHGVTSADQFGYWDIV
jgi:hypothetical protein